MPLFYSLAQLTYFFFAALIAKNRKDHGYRTEGQGYGG